MESEWQETTLGQIVSAGGGLIQTGPFGSQLHAADYVRDGIPCIMPANIVNSCVDLTDIARISASDAKRLAKHLVQEGDIVYSRRGDVTRKVLITAKEKGMFCGTGCLLVRPGVAVNANFLTHHLSTPRNHEWINRHAIGATMPNLNTGILSAVPLRLPSLVTQSAIAAILDSFTHKITLNNQMNQTLEQMAQALFKSWFVDFDPVIDNALAAGHTIPAPLQAKAEQRKLVLASAKTKRLPSDIQQLFPKEFQNTTNLNNGPSTWSTVPLYDLAEFINGAAYKAFEPNSTGNGLPIIKIAELKAGVTAKTGFSTVEMPKKYLLGNNDILFSWSGNPETSIDTFIWTQGPAWLNQHIFKVVPKSHIPRAFILSLLKYLKPTFTAIARDKQTTGLGHVTVKNLKEMDILLPDAALLTAAEKQLKPIWEQVFNNIIANNTLTKLRDTLLPKLISGELKIPEAEQQLEAALA